MGNGIENSCLLQLGISVSSGWGGGQTALERGEDAQGCLSYTQLALCHLEGLPVSHSQVWVLLLFWFSKASGLSQVQTGPSCLSGLPAV